MPTKRRDCGGTYYIKRRVPGVGNVYRSLATKQKGLARTLEDVVLGVARHGHPALVRAWMDGAVDLGTLREAYETGRLPALGEDLRARTVPLDRAVREVLRAKEADVVEATLERYRQGLDHFTRHCGATLGAACQVRDALDTGNVQAFKHRRWKEEEAAKETVNNDLGAVSVLTTYALHQGWISARPRVKRFKTAVRIRYLEREDVTTYMANLRPAFRPLFHLLLGTGMRLGEAEALRVCDVKWDPKGTRVLIEDSKTPQGIRPVFVPGWAAETLRDHIDATALAGTETLFAIPRRTIQKEHNRARKLAGIAPGYTIHDHRHTAAVHLAKAGMPLHLLQQQLGHTKVEMTMRYARFHPDYGDVGGYFERAGEHLGLGSGNGRRPADAVARAAELLGLDVETLRDALKAAGAGNDSGNGTSRAEEKAKA